MYIGNNLDVSRRGMPVRHPAYVSRLGMPVRHPAYVSRLAMPVRHKRGVALGQRKIDIDVAGKASYKLSNLTSLPSFL